MGGCPACGACDLNLEINATGRRDLEKERSDLENALKNEKLDFSATYMVVQTLHAFIGEHPDRMGPETIPALKRVFERSAHVSQKQVFFLYRETADTLITIMTRSPDISLAGEATLTLKEMLGSATNHLHRAVAEALGSLPLSFRGPQLPEKPFIDMPHVTWTELLKRKGLEPGASFQQVGRSMVVDMDTSTIFVVKLAGDMEGANALQTEAGWMDYFGTHATRFPVRFDIPRPFQINAGYVFMLDDVPLRTPVATQIEPKYYAIGFIAPKDYFGYPNDHRKGLRISEEKFRAVILRNAYLFGQLASWGILHNSPIPLFHNRVQIGRREDNGIYQWSRGGRLDAWLTSCRYPNFGVSGIRDFEHFESFAGERRKMYHTIGSYLLSFALVIGSYFRHKAPERSGFDNQGHPVDVRDLFDKTLFKDVMKHTFLEYYHGFMGEPFEEELPLDFDFLADRMIDEMGVDRHMEEILRIADQEAMSDPEFKGFLIQRGYDRETIARMEKGKREITLLTGPHLGGFNDRISLPELIRFIETMSALCISGKYKPPQSQDVRQ
jgi:hypothetical protein